MNKSKTKPEMSRKKYSPQFKDQALAHAEKQGVAQTAKDLGLSESMLYSWRAAQRHGGQPLESQKLQQAEMARLRREISQLQEEARFLKKAAAYFAKESR